MMSREGTHLSHPPRTTHGESSIHSPEQRKECLTHRLQDARAFLQESRAYEFGCALWTPLSHYLAKTWSLPRSGGMLLSACEKHLDCSGDDPSFAERFNALSAEAFFEIWSTYLATVRKWQEGLFFSHNDELAQEVWDEYDSQCLTPDDAETLLADIDTFKEEVLQWPISVWDTELFDRSLLCTHIQQEAKIRKDLEVRVRVKRQNLKEQPYDLPIHVDDGDPGLFEGFFGSDWQRLLTECIPPSFRRLLKGIRIKKFPELFRASDSDIAGEFSLESSEIILYTDNIRPNMLLEIVLHEMGHAIHLMSREEVEARIETLFIPVALRSENAFSSYVHRIAQEEGTIRGLEEDIAETIQAFILYPQILQECDPSRFEVIGRMIEELFPELDLEKLRERTQALNKDYVKRRLTDVSLLRRELKTESALKILSELCPALTLRPLDLVYLRGAPGEIRVRALSENTLFEERFDEEGRIMSQGVKEKDAPLYGSVLKEVEFDAQGRISSCVASVMHERATYFYEGESVVPLRIHFAPLEPEKGEEAYLFEYKSEGTTIQERLTQAPGNPPVSRVDYLFQEGRIVHMTGFMQGKVLFQREYVYDRANRVTQKPLLDHEGSLLESISYSYLSPPTRDIDHSV